MSESRQTHVTLHDIDPQALDQLVQFAYTAEIVVGEGNVQTLLPAASLLQLNGVRDACCKFLLSQLDPSNCLGIRGFADAHSCSDLLKAAHRYVLQHFVDVAKTEEFMLLPLKQVTAGGPSPLFVFDSRPRFVPDTALPTILSACCVSPRPSWIWAPQEPRLWLLTLLSSSQYEHSAPTS
uniref:Kelch like family member 17 n=1 Tax=Pan paniscus TaxID=9597 RepID=A0A2R9AWB9_PANPA